MLWYLWLFYVSQPRYKTVGELQEQLLSLAQSVQDPRFLLAAHYAQGWTSFCLGEFASARAHLEQGIAVYDPPQHQSITSLYGQNPGVSCRSISCLALWLLGYPDQALERSRDALTLAQEIAHPFSLTMTLGGSVAVIHQFRREGKLTQERAEAAITLSTEHGFPVWLATMGTCLRDWALVEQGQGEEGIVQISQGLAAYRASGGEVWLPYRLALLAEAHRKAGQTEEGLTLLAEALNIVDKNEERWYEAEAYRLKGELLLQKAVGGGQKAEPSLQPPTPDPRAQAEQCFQKAIDIARRQQAKSLELRAATSLARLWQQQGKTAEAHDLLSPIYNWFTEGFDTADLKDAKALLEALG